MSDTGGELPFFPLSQLDPPTLEGVARLHLEAMPTLLSDLGLPFVVHYFQAAAADPSVIGFYTLLPGTNLPSGYVIGTPHPDRLMAQLRKPLPWFAGQLLRLLFSRPAVLFQLAVSAFSISGQLPNDPGVIEVSFESISPLARGQGLGVALMRHYLAACRAAGYHSCELSVETNNQVAVAMHKKVGYKVIRTFREGRFERHRMVILL